MTNTGAMASDEVVQLYVTHPAIKGSPIRSLQGFQRIHLDKDAKQTVQFKLADRALSIVDATGARRIEPGKVEAWMGGGQPLARAGMPAPAGVRTQFTVTSGAILPN